MQIVLSLFSSLVLNNRECGGVQNRERRSSFGARRLWMPRVDVLEWAAPAPMQWEPAVCSTAGGRRASVARAVRVSLERGERLTREEA